MIIFAGMIIDDIFNEFPSLVFNRRMAFFFTYENGRLCPGTTRAPNVQLESDVKRIFGHCA